MILSPLRATLWAEAPRLLLLALAYGLLVAVTQAYFTPSGDATSASLVWPASGLALAALLLGGWRLWPAILVAKVACNLWGGQVLAAALLGGVGSSAAAVLGGWLLIRAPGFDTRLAQSRDFLWLALVAVISPAPSAILGAGGLWLFGDLPGSELATSVLGWWQGDALGVLLAAPLLLVWREAPRWRWRQQGIEVAACLMLTLLLGYRVLQAPGVASRELAALTYLPFLPLGWAALRFGRHGAVLVLTLLAVFALLGVAQGEGAFASRATERGLLQLWLYLMVLTSVGLSLALVFNEARVAMARLAESEERFRLLADFAPVGIYQTDAEGACTYSNPRWQEISGISAEQTLGEGWSAVVHPDDRTSVLEGWRSTAAEHREFAMDFRLLRRDGEVRYLRSRARRLFPEHGPGGGF
ncbi:MAG TPA: MASE1 domain-containing protein, partial [Arenimonas sp.]|nr:MASE1 domain-containing protein [Arenimonas sp.]